MPTQLDVMVENVIPGVADGHLRQLVKDVTDAGGRVVILSGGETSLDSIVYGVDQEKVEECFLNFYSAMAEIGGEVAGGVYAYIPVENADATKPAGGAVQIFQEFILPADCEPLFSYFD